MMTTKGVSVYPLTGRSEDPQSKEQKGSLYSKELEGARMRGDWDGDVAITGGASLPWSELIRKYMKHNPHEQVTPSVASFEQQIRSAISAFYKQEGYGDDFHQEDSAFLNGNGQTRFPPALPTDQYGSGWSGEGVNEAVKQLSNLRDASKDSLMRQSIAALQAYALFSTGQDENAVELMHESRFLEDVNLEELKQGQYNENYIVALIMMGYTVYGMANERLLIKRGDKGYIPFAYAGYACTIDLHETIRGGKSANALRGLPADEIERWGEVALYRNALLNTRQGNVTMSLNALRAYQAHAGRWPLNFREPQRVVIYRTYLETLNESIERNGYNLPPSNVTASNDDCRSAAYQKSVIAASASRVEIRDFESERAPRQQGIARPSLVVSKGLGGATSRTTSNRRPAAYRGILPTGPSAWSNEFLTVQKATSDTIARSSHFPQAGHINISALDLADEIVRGWQLNGERGGDWADEVVEFLYLLSKVTFHSQRITRHLFNILVASENYSEAKRALELYIQIVDKAREGDAAEAGGLVEESRRREEGHEGPANGNGALTKESKEKAEKIHLDTDSDKTYIQTLLYGVHVYARYMQEAREADKLARKVVAFVDGDREKTLAKDIGLWAKVKRMAGVARSAFCAVENNSLQRQKLQDEALALLKQSVTLDEQSSETYFALGYLQSEMLDVPSAIRSARRAVELEPANVENWHLLALLVSSQKDFKGALRIAEEGLAEAEDDDEADLNEKKGIVSNGNGNGTSSNGSRSLLLSVDYPPRATERAESILRLMMTHNSLEEIVEGGQAAIEGQREIFEFFHRRIGTKLQAHQSRHKIPVGATNNANGIVSSDQASSIARSSTLGSRQRQTSTVLGGTNQPHSRFHSLTGMGQSGSHHALPFFHSHKEEEATTLPNSNGINAPVMEEDDEDGKNFDKTAGTVEIRARLHVKQQTSMLAMLWLMSAATFRRSGKLSECRMAIQEAERVDPAEAEVWLQLALWFEQQPPQPSDNQSSTTLAIQSLYKALACKGDHVGATVHLARLFLANPSNTSVGSVQDAIANVASPLPQTSDNIQASTLASDLLSHTQSRRISASSAANNNNNSSNKVSESNDKGGDDIKDSQAQSEKKRLATVSLAEGLLISLTQNNGWNVPEAWLFMARVMKETKRWESQRECLEYALRLEKAKTVRALSVALLRV